MRWKAKKKTRIIFIEVEPRQKRTALLINRRNILITLPNVNILKLDSDQNSEKIFSTKVSSKRSKLLIRMLRVKYHEFSSIARTSEIFIYTSHD